MTYARKDRYGMLYQFRTGDGEELGIALEYAKAKHGDDLSGTVYGRPPMIQGVEEDPSIPEGYWLFELKAAEAPPG